MKVVAPILVGVFVRQRVNLLKTCEQVRRKWYGD
jgi:hypothetical protein